MQRSLKRAQFVPLLFRQAKKMSTHSYFSRMVFEGPVTSVRLRQQFEG